LTFSEPDFLQKKEERTSEDSITLTRLFSVEYRKHFASSSNRSIYVSSSTTVTDWGLKSLILTQVISLIQNVQTLDKLGQLPGIFSARDGIAFPSK